MDKIGTLFELLVTAVISEASAMMFLVAATVFLIGLLLLGLFVASRIFGYRTEGTVVGAVKQTRTEQRKRDGKSVEKIRSSLFPVFEYTTRSGEQRQMLSSEGGSGTLKYVTGQAVNLIVREDDGYDDVYDVDQRGALYIGLVLAGLGVYLMIFVGSAAAAFGIGTFVLIALALAYLVRALVLKFAGPKSNDERAESTKSDANKSVAERKAFKASDLHPVEHFKSQDSRSKTA